MKTYDLIIIGSGSMGAAGGYYASRSGLRTLLTTKARTTDKPVFTATSTTTTPTSTCSTVPPSSGRNWKARITRAC